MLLAAKENVCDVMATNGILSDQLDYEKWRSTVLEHAKGTYINLSEYCSIPIVALKN